MKSITQYTLSVAALAMMAVSLTGCPAYYATYDEGYQDGFYTDAKYWEGYDDSYMTEPPDGPILYSGSTIPLLEDDSYDAVHDGLWCAMATVPIWTPSVSKATYRYVPDWYAFRLTRASDTTAVLWTVTKTFPKAVFWSGDYSQPSTGKMLWDYRAAPYIEIFGTGEYGTVVLHEYG